ncbi:carbohydrate ABC transporter permease [Paenibacillus koleovorans]|uniref:carbohydrate ABC transporter permease n=1 Tax=Paenibacillus koleovorans TaxID=121608 RepID=UPI000FDCA077|nr:carbohydrate ABC transporter permease [Paenibacillus koleovorans]
MNEATSRTTKQAPAPGSPVSTAARPAQSAPAPRKRSARRREINSIHPVTEFLLHLFFLLIAVACIFPVLVVLGVSLTDQDTIYLHGYNIIPRVFSWSAYEYLLRDWRPIADAYMISIFVTVVGTIIALTVTALVAYPLSRQDFAFRNFFSFFVFFTMIFGGGLVPWYLVYTNFIDIRDTLWALIVPNHLLSAFYVIIMRTFFTTSIHPSILESAKIDGASELRIFTRIVIPLSLPVLATIGLFYTLSYWNDWFNSLVFMNNDKLINLQYMMYKAMRNLQYLNNFAALGGFGDQTAKLPSETARMAMAIIGMGPIVLAYPFFQKYFVKGLTVGAVKG